jgi:hypothetical protein
MSLLHLPRRPKSQSARHARAAIANQGAAGALDAACNTAEARAAAAQEAEAQQARAAFSTPAMLPSVQPSPVATLSFNGAGVGEMAAQAHPETELFPEVAHEDPRVTEAREALRQTGPAPLARVAKALRAIPARPCAYLRNLLPGTDAGPSEPLTGFPSFAGVSRMSDGSPVVGLFLSEGDKLGRHVLDIPDVVWLGRLIDAAEEARDRLYAAQVLGLDEAAGIVPDTAEAGVL